MSNHPMAGKPAEAGMLVDIPRLITAYFTQPPDPSIPAQRVSFGTSGHRGLTNRLRSPYSGHQSGHLRVPDSGKNRGPALYGRGSHALSAPAFASAMEVLAANEVTVMIAPVKRKNPTKTLFGQAAYVHVMNTNAPGITVAIFKKGVVG